MTRVLLDIENGALRRTMGDHLTAAGYEIVPDGGEDPLDDVVVVTTGRRFMHILYGYGRDVMWGPSYCKHELLLRIAALAGVRRTDTPAALPMRGVSG
jgi:hypothetical protein